MSNDGKVLEKLDLIVDKLAEHDQKLEKAATKEEVAEVRDKVLTVLDENTALLRDIRQEQESTSAALTRHDKTIENHKKRITQLEK